MMFRPLLPLLLALVALPGAASAQREQPAARTAKSPATAAARRTGAAAKAHASDTAGVRSRDAAGRGTFEKAAPGRATGSTRSTRTAAAAAAAARARAKAAAAARAGYDTAVSGLRGLMVRDSASAAEFANVLAEDFVLIMPDGRPIRGRAAFRAFLRRVHAVYTVRDFSVETASFHADGDLAYAWGVERSVGVRKTGGKPSSEAVQFLAVYERQRDGHWLLKRAVHTPLPASRRFTGSARAR